MQHASIARPKPLIVAHLLLLLAEQPRHGYELAASLKTWEFEGITPSLVYRELARLQEEGLVQSFWAASQARGPARHMYEITDEGREYLAECADDIDGLISHLTGLVSRFASARPASSQRPQAAGHGEQEEPGQLKARRRFRKPR